MERLASGVRKVDGDRRDGDKEWTRVNQQFYKVEGKGVSQYSEPLLFELSLWEHKKRSQICPHKTLRLSVSIYSITMRDKPAQSFDQQTRPRLTTSRDKSSLPDLLMMVWSVRTVLSGFSSLHHRRLLVSVAVNLSPTSFPHDQDDKLSLTGYSCDGLHERESVGKWPSLSSDLT